MPVELTDTVLALLGWRLSATSSTFWLLSFLEVPRRRCGIDENRLSFEWLCFFAGSFSLLLGFSCVTYLCVSSCSLFCNNNNNNKIFYDHEFYSLKTVERCVSKCEQQRWSHWTIGNFAGDWFGAVSNCTMELFCGKNFDSVFCACATL